MVNVMVFSHIYELYVILNSDVDDDELLIFDYVLCVYDVYDY